MRTRRWPALLIVMLMLILLPSCGDRSTGPARKEDTRVFIDSAGREVEVPAQIDRVALSGPAAQIVLFALCPDKLVGISEAWSAEAEKYLETKYYKLPEIGQLYGSKAELNPETLLESGAQIVIDVGAPKAGIVKDMDDLQRQTGIPFVHINAETGSTGNAYRMLGDLLNMPEEAESIASYCDGIYARILEIAESVEKAKVLYVTGDTGQNVIAGGSYHAEIIDLLTDNRAVVDEPSSKGLGNEVGMEQIMIWDPDVVIFSPDSIYDTVSDDPAWQSMRAVKNGQYYKVPYGPYNWMGFPPSAQRYLGMMWLCKVLYPEAAQYDLYSEVRDYYKMFYHCDLTRAQYDALVADSLGSRPE